MRKKIEWLDAIGQRRVIEWHGAHPSTVVEVKLEGDPLTTFLTAVDDESRDAIYQAMLRGDSRTADVICDALAHEDIHGEKQVVHAFQHDDDSGKYDPHLRPMGQGDHKNAWPHARGWRDDPSWRPRWAEAMHKAMQRRDSAR